MENIREKFDTIYSDTYQKVLTYIFRKCGTVAETEDILQETYTELFCILAQREEAYIRYPEAFVMRLAKSKVYRYYSEKERQATCTYVENTELLEQKEDEATTDNVTWEDNLIDKLTADEVMKYIAGKDELTKEIFYQHFFQDKTIKEIAEKHGIKESTVKTRLYRTLKELGGMKRFVSIIAIILLAALLAKPVYTWAEEAITNVKNYFIDNFMEKMFEGAFYIRYKELIEDGVVSEDIRINIRGKEYSFEKLEEIWFANPWLEEMHRKETERYPEEEIDYYLN